MKNSLLRKACDFKVGGPDFCAPEKYEWAREFVTEKPNEDFKVLRTMLK